MTELKKVIDFKYDTLAFKGRAEIRLACNDFISSFRKARGEDPPRIVLKKDTYIAARQALAKVKYAEDDAKFYFDSIPVFGQYVDA